MKILRFSRNYENEIFKEFLDFYEIMKIFRFSSDLKKYLNLAIFKFIFATQLEYDVFVWPDLNLVVTRKRVSKNFWARDWFSSLVSLLVYDD